MSGFLLRGEVFIQRTNSVGIPSGKIVGPVNAEALEIEPDVEEIVRTSKNKSTYGKALAKVNSPNPTKIKLKLDETDSKLIAEALGAEHSNLNQQATTGAAVPVLLHSDGSWSEIGVRQITSTGWKVMQNTTELAEGTDYEVKWATGLIRPLAGGAIAAGGEVKIDYQALALEGSRIKGGEIQDVNWAIKLSAQNVVTGEKVEGEIPLAQLRSSSPINLLQNEFMAPEFEGVASVAQGKNYDYQIDVIK
ncbi:hypothetical protein JL49_13300 [Pseudoalteromonas luteoviolacea]|nr:hypothetical protein JL49_13300 [Pseudoalteromonas luteoviolacea]